MLYIYSSVSIGITTNVVSLNSAQAGLLDSTLCDKVCLTCGRLVVFSGYPDFLQ